MEVKVVQIPASTHRKIAILAAKRGVTITSIVAAACERAVSGTRKRKRKPAPATPDGPPAGA
jgi:hypothetical protein